MRTGLSSVYRLRGRTRARLRMTATATLSRDRFTQTDPMPMGAGTAFESSYAYVGSNPLVYVDPSGLCRQTTSTSNPIQSAMPDRLAFVSSAVSSGGPDPRCGSLWAKIVEKVLRNKRLGGGSSIGGTHGLMFRFQEMLIDGYSKGGRASPGSAEVEESFRNHRTEYENQRRGLNRNLKDWEKNCPDDGPPSSLQSLERLTVYRWAGTPAPSWDEVRRLALGSAESGPNWFQRNIFKPINDVTDSVWKYVTTPHPLPRGPIPFPIPVPVPV